jgi:hypothetical protein
MCFAGLKVMMGVDLHLQLDSATFDAIMTLKLIVEVKVRLTLSV